MSCTETFIVDLQSFYSGKSCCQLALLCHLINYWKNALWILPETLICGAFMCEKDSLFVNKYVCSSFCFYSVNFLSEEKIIVQEQKFLLLCLQLLSQNTNFLQCYRVRKQHLQNCFNLRNLLIMHKQTN